MQKVAQLSFWVSQSLISHTPKDGSKDYLWLMFQQEQGS